MVALLAGAAGLAAWLSRTPQIRHEPLAIPEKPPDTTSIEAWHQQARAAIQAAGTLGALREHGYIPGSALDAWHQEHASSLRPLSRQALNHLPEPLKEKYQHSTSIISSAASWRQQHNEAFVRRQLKDLTNWFDTALSRPLTAAQRRAVITNEDNNLIVAGAGTGKTTTIEARALYLIHQKLAQSQDILILSYNRAVVEEVQSRFKARGLNISVETFHSQGLKILATAEGRKPAMSRLATHSGERLIFLHKQLMSLLEENHIVITLALWFVDGPAQSILIEECKTPEERILRERGLGRITLSGKRLSSLSEVLVANWLSLNGIAWEYERRYPHAPPSATKRDYTPDFYLPEEDLWIEVWAVDHQGRTSKTIDAKAYLEGMAWKRDLHKTNRTRLVEVFQDEIWSEQLSELLKKKMAQARVRTRPLSHQEQQELFASKSKPIRRFILLIDRFLQLYRGGAWTMEALKEHRLGLRDRTFLRLFAPLHQRYREHLVQEQRIDFHDMLLRASQHLHDGRHTSPYQHIMVDEFQDISHTRLAMLEGMRACVSHSRLFLVGDDWQSIYQFAGSDIALFTQATSMFDYCARTDLDRTFRLAAPVQTISSGFVMTNPNQLKKHIHPHSQTGSARIRVYRHTGNMKGAIEQIAHSIRTDLPEGGSVFVLGRYNSTLHPELLRDFSRKLGSQLAVTAHTVHRAKGLEADHVLLLDVNGGEFGFPCRLEDDPVLRLVTHNSTRFPDGEERRLFYVALTRTKGGLSIITDARNPSDFILELRSGAYEQHIEFIDIGEDSTPIRLFLCPRCQGTSIRKKKRRVGGFFWGCTYWPDCEGTLKTCPHCDAGALEPSGPGRSRCSNCAKTTENCPLCKVGILMRKSSQYGVFWGCSEFRQSHCNFKRKA